MELTCRKATATRLPTALQSAFSSTCLGIAVFLSASAAAVAGVEIAAAEEPTKHVTEGVDCSIAKSAITSASRIRGLAIKHPVPCKLQDEAQVERYLRQAIEEKVPRVRIEQEGRAYQYLGAIPLDFKYFDGMIELYTSQLGGYYDPEKDYYAMAAWMPAIMQMPIAVHELTHALQDQHFQLDKMMDHKTASSDALVARSALVEGDATAVMMDYQRAMLGQEGIENIPSVAEIMMQNIGSAMFSPGLHKAPPALQAMLIFPYVSGLRFVHELLRDGGYRRVDQVYKRPPATSEQILHPEKYASGELPNSGENDARLAIEQLTAKKVELESEKPEYSDRFGEFFVATLLGTWIPSDKASSGSHGWNGDQALLFKQKNGKEAFAWVTHWDSVADGEEFFNALRDGYEIRFSAKALSDDKSAFRFPDSPAGAVEAVLNGSSIVLTVVPKN